MQLVDRLEQLQALHADWQHLAARCPDATFFGTPDWLLTWWRHFGRRRPLLALADWEQGRLAGLLLLMADRLGPARRLRFLGTGGTDYLDALVEPGREPQFWQRVLEVLAGLPWDLADLQQVPAGSPTLEALPPAAAHHCWRAEICPQEPCPFLDLPVDWECFRASLGKKMRWNLGYYPRLAQRQLGAEVVDCTGERRETAMERLFALHSRRWRRRWLPGAFATARVRAFHRELAAACDQAGTLRLYGLAQDGDLHAILYCYRWGDRVYYYQGGFDPALARYSPGTILVGRAIADALATGARGLDFLRGGESYKYRWGAQDRLNHRLRLVRPGWRGRAGLSLSRCQQEVEQSVKKIASKAAAPA